LNGLSRKQLDYLLAQVAGTRYMGDVDPQPLISLVEKATVFDLELIYRTTLSKKTSGSMISSPFNVEDRAVRDGYECHYVRYNAAGAQIAPPFIEIVATNSVAPVPIKDFVFEDPQDKPIYNEVLHGVLTEDMLKKKPEMSQEMVRACVVIEDETEVEYHNIGAYVYEKGTPKTPAQLAYMLASYTKLDKGVIVMGAPSTAFVKLGIVAISPPGILTVASLLTNICKVYLNKLVASKQASMKGRPYVDWLYSIFKGLPKEQLAAMSHTVFTTIFPQFFVEKTDQEGAKYSGGFTRTGAQYFKNCAILAKGAQQVLKILPKGNDEMVVPVMAASIPCTQAVPKDRKSYMDAYKFLSSSRALRSEDDKLMSGLTQGFNGSGCPSRALARVRMIVKIILANVVRKTFVRIEQKYLITVASSIHYYRPELCPLLYFEGEPVSSLQKNFDIQMRHGLGTWKDDVIDLLGEAQNVASARQEEWEKSSRESSLRHSQKYNFYKEAGAKDIVMRIRTTSIEEIAEGEIHWYTCFMSPHAGEVIVSTRQLKLPALCYSESLHIGLYKAQVVEPQSIPELMIQANFRRNAQPLLQAIWCDPSDSFVYSGTTVELEEDQEYAVQLAAFEADQRINELIEGMEKVNEELTAHGRIDSQEEVELRRRSKKAVVGASPGVAVDTTEEEAAVEAVEMM